MTRCVCAVATGALWQVCGTSRMQSTAGIWICGRALGMAGSQKYGFSVVGKCFWGNVENSGELQSFRICTLCFFCPFAVAHISFFCVLTEFILVSESNAKLAMCAASKSDCLLLPSFVSTQLISSSWISELQFAHSVSPSFELVVAGIMQALCSLAVQNQVFFTYFVSRNMQMPNCVGLGNMRTGRCSRLR